jgi:hypothetical protein
MRASAGSLSRPKLAASTSKLTRPPTWGERGAVEIETERRLRTFLRSVEPEEFRLAVNETPDQPGRGYAIDPEIFARRPGPPLKVGAGKAADLVRCRHRLAAGRGFERHQCRMRLPLRLAGEIIDGDQRREFAANSAQRLRRARIRRGHRPHQRNVVGAAIEQGDDLGPLLFAAPAEAIDVGHALRCPHLLRNPCQGPLMLGRVRQQEYAIAQGGAAQCAQRAPDAHAARGLARRQTDKQGKEIHVGVTSQS